MGLCGLKAKYLNLNTFRDILLKKIWKNATETENQLVNSVKVRVKSEVFIDNTEYQGSKFVTQVQMEFKSNWLKSTPLHWIISKFTLLTSPGM